MTHAGTHDTPPLSFAADSPWLAPLAGFSDLPFRLLCRELGAAVACTEMVSAKGLIYGQGKKTNATEDLLRTVPPIADHGRAPRLSVAPGILCAPYAPCGGDDDSPLVVQLFGAEVRFMSAAVAHLVKQGYAWFDLNMGCSVPKVCKSASGAAMLRDTGNALQVARAMLAEAGPGRVGFKLRLGWEAGQEVYRDLALRLQDAGAGWITLHPRYARQAFSGRADWDALAALVQELTIPVIASGDLFTAHDAVACMRHTGAATVMFARGAMGNPAIFREYTRLMRSGGLAASSLPEHMSAGELLAIIRRHASLAQEYSTEPRGRRGLEPGLLKMRTFVPRYVKHFSGARALRQQLTRCDSWQMLDELLHDFFASVSVATASAPQDAGPSVI